MNVATSSLFSQLLSLVDSNGFAKLVRETGSGRRSTGFASRDHFAVMLFCQIAQAGSLREIDGGLSSCDGKLQHLGMDGAPGRSTLSHANTHRPAEFFEKLFYQVLGNVTRLKKNALWTSHEARPVKPGGKVRRDTEGRFCPLSNPGGYPADYRITLHTIAPDVVVAKLAEMVRDRQTKDSGLTPQAYLAKLARSVPAFAADVADSLDFQSLPSPAPANPAKPRSPA